MCGIVGYVGAKQAAPILLEGLSKLEYRGYDSAGLAVRDGEGDFQIVKAKGRLAALIEKTDGGKALRGGCGIGHTRWATHGEPSETNAHPHLSYRGLVVGVHNGIIENYQEIKQRLIRHGYVFHSQTDTEAAINLIEYYLFKYKAGPLQAIAHAMMRIRGSYALELMFTDQPGKIYAARKDSPMIIGLTEGESYVASDVPAILKHTRDVYYIGNQEIAVLTAGKAEFYNIDEEPIEKELVHVDMDPSAAEKGGYRHFMMKEIHEEPKSVKDTLNALTKDGKVDLSAYGLTREVLASKKLIYIIGCGSAFHVGAALQYVIEGMANTAVRVEYASEFRYRKLPLEQDSLLIVISQSGETADSLAALRKGKAAGILTIGIVNVIGSTIAREADRVIYTVAGPEIAVATTKAYSAQLIAGYAFAIALAKAKGTISEETEMAYVKEIASIPAKIETCLKQQEAIQRFASKRINDRDIFFVGRGIDYCIGLEGSLKLKEISYIHSEAYAAGELKHGTISLIEPNTLVVGILTQPELYEKTISNMVECKSRGGYLLAVSTMGNEDACKVADIGFYVPSVNPYFMTSLAIIPLQLLAYYVAVSKGLDVDKPRNLAKSVTVE